MRDSEPFTLGLSPIDLSRVFRHTHTHTQAHTLTRTHAIHKWQSSQWHATTEKPSNHCATAHKTSHNSLLTSIASIIMTQSSQITHQLIDFPAQRIQLFRIEKILCRKQRLDSRAWALREFRHRLIISTIDGFLYASNFCSSPFKQNDHSEIKQTIGFFLETKRNEKWFTFHADRIIQQKQRNASNSLSFENKTRRDDDDVDDNSNKLIKQKSATEYYFFFLQEMKKKMRKRKTNLITGACACRLSMGNARRVATATRTIAECDTQLIS